VVITRTTVGSGTFGDEPNAPIIVAETKGDMQAGPKTRRRLQAAGVDAEARLFLDSAPFRAVQIQDRVAVTGFDGDFVVEEKSDIDQALLLKSR